MNNPIIEESCLRDLLPHGSGIDSEWVITEHKNGNFTCENSFHSMDENGYYDGYMPFTVRLFRHTQNMYNPLKGPLEGKIQVVHRKNDVDFSLSCNENKRRSFYGLKEYLNDTLYHALESVLTKRDEMIDGPGD